MIEIHFKTLVAQMVNFGILIFFLNKFVFKTLGVFIDKRSQGIKDSFAEIEKDREEVAKMREDYQEQMTSLDKENYQRMQEAIQKGQEAAQQTIAEAEEKVKQLQEKARENIERDKMEALKEVRVQVGDLAVEIAGKIVGETYDAGKQKKLINGFIDKIEKLGIFSG